jgi:hypothetical protein
MQFSLAFPSTQAMVKWTYEYYSDVKGSDCEGLQWTEVNHDRVWRRSEGVYWTEASNESV